MVCKPAVAHCRVARWWVPLAAEAATEDLVGFLPGHEAPLVGGGVVVDANAGVRTCVVNKNGATPEGPRA